MYPGNAPIFFVSGVIVVEFFSKRHMVNAKVKRGRGPVRPVIIEFTYR